MTADQAREFLRKGNARFVAGWPEHPRADADQRRRTADQGQRPFAAVVSCSDSRVPVEILFDCGIGDVFVVRVAGNVCDINEIAAVEYVVEHLSVALVVVMGHSRCGAITAVANGAVLHGNTLFLRDKIVPAANAVRKEQPHLQGEALIEEAIKANIWKGIEDLLGSSLDIRQLVRASPLSVEGAYYDLVSGKVDWLGRHPRMSEVLDGYSR